MPASPCWVPLIWVGQIPKGGRLFAVLLFQHLLHPNTHTSLVHTQGGVDQGGAFFFLLSFPGDKHFSRVYLFFVLCRMRKFCPEDHPCLLLQGLYNGYPVIPDYFGSYCLDGLASRQLSCSCPMLNGNCAYHEVLIPNIFSLRLTAKGLDPPPLSAWS